MLKVGVLYGGRSGEHEVSRCSAASVIAALDPAKYEILAIGIDKDGRWYPQVSPEIVEDRDFGKTVLINKKGNWLVNHFEDKGKLWLYNREDGDEAYVDVVFPVLHGTYGEDGTLQGLLELAMVPYVGADMGGSYIGIDKDVTKRLLENAGVPVVPWITTTGDDWKVGAKSIIRDATNRLGLPLFVKPVCAGSSVGIKKVKKEDDLGEAVEFALRYDTRAIIEKGIECREIECSVLGNEHPEASMLGEILPHHEFYSYEAKYIDPNGAELKIPANLDGVRAAEIRKTAITGYKALNCSGMARVDFLLDKKTNVYYLNEINTIPGFTSISMYPKLWEATGLKYDALIDRLISLAIERHRKKAAVCTELGKID